MNETWRSCGLGYEVSDTGRVRRVLAAPGARVGRILRPQLGTWGYFVVSLSLKGRPRSVQVHVLVAEAFLGKRPGRKDVNHRNGDKTDNRTVNLEYVTRSENHLHAFRTGLRPPVGRKLTEAKVRELRGRHAAGKTLTEIAQSLGISQSLASMVASGRRWKEVA